jgi:hypothetical protein
MLAPGLRVVGLHQAEGMPTQSRRARSAIAEKRLAEKHLSENQMFGSGQAAGQSPRPKKSPDLHQLVHQRVRTAMDIRGRKPEDQAVHGQIAVLAECCLRLRNRRPWAQILCIAVHVPLEEEPVGVDGKTGVLDVD